MSSIPTPYAAVVALDWADRRHAWALATQAAETPGFRGFRGQYTGLTPSAETTEIGDSLPGLPVAASSSY